MDIKKILLIEDHPLMRTGIKSLFNDSQELQISSEASTLKEAKSLITQSDFDLILLDLSLPDGFGLDFIPTLQLHQPGIPIVALTMHNEEPYLAKALKLGASGYVVKDLAPERLMETLKRVLSGEKCFFISQSEAILTSKKTFSSTISPVKTIPLSPREEKVMTLITQGLTLTEIAENLNISVKTVFTYRVRIFKKLNVKNNIELINHYMSL